MTAERLQSEILKDLHSMMKQKQHMRSLQQENLQFTQM